MTRWFGTDGIRGRANREPLTPSFICDLGQALGKLWNHQGTAVLATDGRLSGDLVRGALSSGLMSAGIDVAYLGNVTTPALSFLARENETVGGVMISASHNEFSDNGIKCFQPSGEKFTEEMERTVEEHLESGKFERVEGEGVGSYCELERGVETYLDRLSGNVVYDGHVVVDCANGASSDLVPRFMSELASDVTVINNQPDGTNINEESGSLHPETLVEAVETHEAEAGFALDGDGDRVIGVDERGTPVNGDALMNMLAASFCGEGEGIVVTVMSNLGLRKGLDSQGIQYEVVGVGDRNVYRRMKQRDWRLGGEQSGHIIDREWLPTGDGLRTLVSVLEILSKNDKTMSEWNNEIEDFPQVLHNIEVDSKPELESLDRTNETINRVERKLGDRGRVLVRYSGTEPVARIMLEGPDEQELNQMAKEIGEVMATEINQSEVPASD